MLAAFTSAQLCIPSAWIEPPGGSQVIARLDMQQEVVSVSKASYDAQVPDQCTETLHYKWLLLQ